MQPLRSRHRGLRGRWIGGLSAAAFFVLVFVIANRGADWLVDSHQVVALTKEATTIEQAPHSPTPSIAGVEGMSMMIQMEMAVLPPNPAAPVAGKVLTIRKGSDNRITDVEISVGSDHGIKKGQLLNVSRRDDKNGPTSFVFIGQIRIVELKQDTAIGTPVSRGARTQASKTPAGAAGLTAIPKKIYITDPETGKKKLVPWTLENALAAEAKVAAARLNDDDLEEDERKRLEIKLQELEKALKKLSEAEKPNTPRPKIPFIREGDSVTPSD